MLNDSDKQHATLIFATSSPYLLDTTKLNNSDSEYTSASLKTYSTSKNWMLSGVFISCVNFSKQCL